MDLNAPPFSVMVVHQDAFTAVALTGDLDLATAPQFRRAMCRLVDTGHTRIVLDVREVGFCDSTGLSAILGLHQRLQALDGCLELREPCLTMRKVLEITATDRILNVTR